MFVFPLFRLDKRELSKNCRRKEFPFAFLDRTRMADESDDELPANWQAGKTSDGQVFYINHQTQQTQWEHPITKKVQIISKGENTRIRRFSPLFERFSCRIAVRLERNNG